MARATLSKWASDVMATSRDLRVPKMIERRDDALEVAALGLLQPGKDFLEWRAEGFANDFRTLEEIKRVDPGGRQRRSFDAFRVALNRGTGIDPIADTVPYAGKDRSNHEVRIGVGTGDAMFDPDGGAMPTRYAQGHGAIVEAPMRRHGHVGLRHIAPVGVGRLRPDGHEVGHGFAHAAQGMTEQRRDWIADKQVLSRLVLQA